MTLCHSKIRARYMSGGCSPATLCSGRLLPGDHTEPHARRLFPRHQRTIISLRLNCHDRPPSQQNRGRRSSARPDDTREPEDYSRQPTLPTLLRSQIPIRRRAWVVACCAKIRVEHYVSQTAAERHHVIRSESLPPRSTIQVAEFRRTPAPFALLVSHNVAKRRSGNSPM
jgi:hypothetical protein